MHPFPIAHSGAQYNTMLGSEDGCVGVRVSERVNMTLNIARTQRSEQNTGTRTLAFKVCDKNMLNHKSLIYIDLVLYLKINYSLAGWRWAFKKNVRNVCMYIFTMYV